MEGGECLHERAVRSHTPEAACATAYSMGAAVAGRERRVGPDSGHTTRRSTSNYGSADTDSIRSETIADVACGDVPSGFCRGTRREEARGHPVRQRGKDEASLSATARADSSPNGCAKRFFMDGYILYSSRSQDHRAAGSV